MPPRAWRSGLRPAELSFRVPHFFHQTRRGQVQCNRLANPTSLLRLERLPAPRTTISNASLVGLISLYSVVIWLNLSPGKSKDGQRQLTGVKHAKEETQSRHDRSGEQDRYKH